MAEKKENALSAKSSVTSSDYLRLVGSNGVSYKQLVTDVAKYIVENYAGSSLAGSSQAPKTAIDALKTSVDSLNSKLPVAFTTFDASTSGRTVTLGTGYRGVLFVLDSAAARCGEYLVGSSGSGNVASQTVVAASSVTIDTSVTGQITITPDSGTRKLAFMTAGGNIPS